MNTGMRSVGRNETGLPMYLPLDCQEERGICSQCTPIAALLNAQEREADKTAEGVLLPFVNVTYLPSQTPEFDRPVLWKALNVVGCMGGQPCPAHTLCVGAASVGRDVCPN